VVLKVKATFQRTKEDRMSIDHLVKVEEAATALSLSKFYLYKRAKDGTVPCYRQGKLLRFNIQEVKDAMRQPAGEK
jgi:excisionase family DNA binding protein